ncbi:MAG: helix-turn-helix domain-containing protein [Bacillaceae bacterium]|nr:helix-turn-helix domain-containing protein [Bacillaceae bacterium]
MDQETLRLANVLADSTRFSIYQYIFNNRKAVTVHEVADKFDIHPNVARLHLSKLEDVNLLSSRSEKTGKGGRPSRLYHLSDEVISLQFPPRDYQLLAQIAIEALANLGKEGQKALTRMGERFGREAARQAIEKEHITTRDRIDNRTLDHIHRLALAQGLNPQIEIQDDQSVRIKVFNCTFQETAMKYPQFVCQMHHAFLKGMFKEFFSDVQVIEENSIIAGSSSCDYTILLTSNMD